MVLVRVKKCEGVERRFDFAIKTFPTKPSPSILGISLQQVNEVSSNIENRHICLCFLNRKITYLKYIPTKHFMD